MDIVKLLAKPSFKIEDFHETKKPFASKLKPFFLRKGKKWTSPTELS
jgi:hypothetical protein